MAEGIINKNEIFEGGNPFDEATKGLAEFLKLLKDLKTDLQAVASIKIQNVNKIISGESVSGTDYKKMTSDLNELNNIKNQTVEINKREAQIIKEQQRAAESLERQRSKAYQQQFLEEQKQLDKKQKEIDLLNKTSLTLKEQSQLLTILRNRYRDLTDEQLKNTKATQTLLAQITALDTNLKKHDALLGQHQRTVGQYGVVWNKVNGILAQAGIFLGISGMINLGKEVVKVRAEFEKFEAVLTTTLGGNRGKAKEFLNDIAEFAAETPFQVEELTSAFIKLANRGIELTIPQMKKLGDIASALGKPFEQLNEAILDVNNQKRWTEIGIKASTEGDKVKLSWKGVTEVVERSEAGIIQGLENFTKRVSGVSGQMDAIARTSAGKFSNLKDNFDLLYNEIGKRFQGAINILLDSLTSGTKAMRDFFAPVESNVIKDEIDNVNALVKTLKENVDNVNIRNKILDELQSKYPDYFSNLNREKDLIGQINERLKMYNEQRSIDVQQTAIKEQEKDILDKINEAENERIRLIKLKNKAIDGTLTTLEYLQIKNELAFKSLTGGTVFDILNEKINDNLNNLTRLNTEYGLFKKRYEFEINVPEPIKKKIEQPKELTDEQKKEAAKFLKDRESAEDDFYKRIEQIRKNYYDLGKNEQKKAIDNLDLEYQNEIFEFSKFMEKNSKYLNDEQKRMGNEYLQWFEKIYVLKRMDLQKKFNNEQIDREYELAKMKYEINENSTQDLLKLERDYLLRKLNLMNIHDKDYKTTQYKILLLDKKINEESYDFKLKLIEKELSIERGLIILKTENVEKRNKKLLELEIEGYEKRLKLAEEYLTKEALLTGSPEQILIAMQQVKEYQKKISDAKTKLMAENAKFGSTEHFAVMFGVSSDDLEQFREGWEQVVEIVQNSISSIIDEYKNLTNAEYERSEAALEASKKNIDTLYNQLQVESDLNRQGLANDSLKIKMEIENEKKKQKELQRQRDEAFEKKKESDKLSLTVDSILQASNIATSISNLFSSLSTLGPLGTALAVAASAVLVSSFIAQKTMAYEQINSQTPKFADGGWVGGKKHSEGGTFIEAERDEFIVKASNAKRSKNLIEMINSGKINDIDYKNFMEINNITKSGISLIIDNKDNKEYNEKMLILQKQNNRILSDFIKFDGKYYIDSKGNRMYKQ